MGGVFVGVVVDGAGAACVDVARLAGDDDLPRRVTTAVARLLTPVRMLWKN